MILNNKNEIWKSIPGFPGYEVSDQGRVRSFWIKIVTTGVKGFVVILKTAPQKILIQTKDKDGYLVVMLRVNQKPYRRRVHRLVLAAFVGPCPPGMEACHGDDIRNHNDLENLKWDWPCNNRPKHMGKGEKNGRARLTKNQVIQIRALADSGYSMTNIAQEFSMTISNISRIVHRKRWAHIS